MKIFKLYDEEIFTSEGISRKKEYDKWKINSEANLAKLNNLILESNRIPLITHNICLYINKNNLCSSQINQEIMLKTRSRLAAEEPTMQNFIWTDSSISIPIKLLKIPNVKIQNIDQLKENKLWSNIEYIFKNYSENLFLLDRLNDILSLIIIQKYGGIYLDTDYEIYNANKFLEYTKAFNFIATKEIKYDTSLISNSIFAASKNHLIINTAIDLVNRNLNQYDLVPLYIKRPASNFDKVALETGPGMLSVAYYKSNNINGSKDMLFPSEILSNYEYARSLHQNSLCYHSLSNETKALYASNAIGADLFCGRLALSEDKISYFSINDAGILFQEGVNGSLDKIINNHYTSDDLKNVLIQDNAYHIPPIVHFVYIKNQNSPAQLNKIYTNKIIKNINRLSKEDPSFKHYIWTNSLSSLPNELKNQDILEIKLIDELSSNELLDIIKNLIINTDKSSFIQANAIIRFIALQRYGGLYLDNDYQIFKPKEVIKYMKNFDFFTTKETPNSNSFLSTSIIGTIADHPIINNANNMISRNFNWSASEEIPSYVKFPIDNYSKQKFETSNVMFTVAYIKNNNVNDNTDAIISPYVLSDYNYARAITNDCKCCFEMSFHEYELHREIAVGGELFCPDL